MNDVLFIIALILVFILSAFVLPVFMVRRATKKVIVNFMRAGAVSSDSAKPLEEIGIRVPPSSLLQRMFSRRDYNMPAIQALMQGEILRMGEGNTYYLDEDRLRNTGMADKIGLKDRIY